MNEVVIVQWQRKYEAHVIKLILSIQSAEFLIPITEADQPDLKSVDTFYQQDNGNFWVALSERNVVGTIALKDIGQQQVALRKMFVHKTFRGSDQGVANKLFVAAIEWCIRKNIQDIYLGTVEDFRAAQRFYEKNGFERIEARQLPKNFPLMQVDTIFYHLSIKY